MRGGTFGAFVDNLILISTCYILSRDGKKREGGRTIALTEFPLGPVTETQRPQFAESSHASPEKATPDRSEGSV
jgi:hypothetical protein